MDDRAIAIQLSGIKKMYKLGQIGGGTLQADLQSWWARKHGKEDPNTIIGQEQRLVGKTFMALNGVDLTVYQGEALGIIGANGAGKSTMLKLLSRVTAPTEGEIDIYGRIASMLEVGTGFNGEMTGRENVYMNGAILGMTKAEIDAKMEDIIEFSEVRDFIDTPVKRYSSGMYVKLAFSVAAHLDSEIMIMDEVLAVGDMAFQKKCITKMREAAKKEGRTVLYVSHNMNTIRQLCDRCIVLDQGKIIFDGDVEEAIEVYSEESDSGLNTEYSWCEDEIINKKLYVYKAFLDSAYVNMTENLAFTLMVHSTRDIKSLCLRSVLFTPVGEVLGIIPSDQFSLSAGDNLIRFHFSTKELAPGQYSLTIIICEKNGVNYLKRDMKENIGFVVNNTINYYNIDWQKRYWGNVYFNQMTVEKNAKI